MANPHQNFSYEKAAKDLKHLFNQLFTYKAKSIIKVEYNGEDIKSSSVTTTSYKISESFSSRNIEYDKEQGRDSLDVFINKVFQLGYSVGFENAKEQYKFLADIGTQRLEELKEDLKILKNENVVRSTMD